MDERSDDKAPVITQEMIDLYDDYTHLSLDRRKFMDNLVKLTGSTALATTVATMIGASAKAQGLSSETDAGIVVENVTYPGAKGEMKGYLVTPAGDGPFPAVIVVHENRGLIPHIKDVTRRMALEGFVALAPDFLSDLGGTPADEEAARPLFQQLDLNDVAANGVATIAYLRTVPKSNGKVGAIGFCWGGGTVNRIAVASPDLLAAVPYYGAQPDAADVPKIKGRVMAHYGGLDERINAGIPAFEEALKAAGTDYQIFVYEGANHAFNNDTSAARYDKAAADLAWQRTVDFFRETLS
jgi:carboxymethylenebutenolidase